MRIVILAVMALSIAGCVSSGKYKAAAERADSLAAEATESKKTLQEARGTIQGLNSEMERLGLELKDAQSELAGLQKAHAGLQSEHDSLRGDLKEAKKFSELLRKENVRLEKGIEKMKETYAGQIEMLKAFVEDIEKSIFKDGEKGLGAKKDAKKAEPAKRTEPEPKKAQ